MNHSHEQMQCPHCKFFKIDSFEQKVEIGRKPLPTPEIRADPLRTPDYGDIIFSVIKFVLGALLGLIIIIPLSLIIGDVFDNKDVLVFCILIGYALGGILLCYNINVKKPLEENNARNEQIKQMNADRIANSTQRTEPIMKTVGYNHECRHCGYKWFTDSKN